MSFIEDTQVFGIVVALFGLLGIITGITMADYYLWLGLGEILTGILFIILGVYLFLGVALIPIGDYFENLDTKMGAMTAFIATVGISFFVEGIMSIIGGVLYTAIISIIFGVITLFVVLKNIKDETKVGNNKIIWILLAVIFVFGIIGVLMSLSAGALGIVYGLVAILMYVILFLYLTSEEVKTEMGA